MHLIIHTDGGARGNPGPAAIGVVIDEVISDKRQDTRMIKQFGKRIGETTNNVAEYMAVVEALRHVLSNIKERCRIDFFLDSTLVVNQLNGLFKVKDARLRELLVTVRTLEQEIGGTIFYHVIRREQNTRADALVNEALDSPHVV
jgi:ribonuclease HI